MNHDASSNNDVLIPFADILLTGAPLTLAQLRDCFGRPLRVKLDPQVWAKVDASAARVADLAGGKEAIYGVNTGFGHLCTRRIEAGDLARLQENLILSHAVGVGRLIPDVLVRLMILFKIQALCHGFSGVNRATVQMLADLLEHDALPIVPSQGSLGASGDLAPLAHLVLPLIGRGEVRLNGAIVDTSTAFEQLQLRPINLGPKEGLALINGTQMMSAYGIGLILRARHLLKHADVIASMSLEGLRGSLKPFAERLHALRPHTGAIETAGNVRKLMRGSEILDSHAECGKVQDPYSLRCVPQVHGAVRQAVAHAEQVLMIEVNAVTDNPVIFEDGETISGGLFHGEPLAIVLDYLAIATAELASIAERRIYLLLSGHDELPALLMQETGLNSGFMLPQYTAAALVSENKVLAHPASVDSIPTSLGQEDHVSMGATAATKAWQIMDNVETVLAIETMCAAQALDYRMPLEPGLGVKLAHSVIRDHIEHAETDRLFGDDIQSALALLRARSIVQAVEKELGELS